MNTVKFIYQFAMSFWPLIAIILAILFNYITLTQFIIGYIAYCIYVQCTTRTELLYTKTKFNEKLLSFCPELSKPCFKPYFLLPFSVQQMLIVAFMKVKNSNKLRFTKEKVNKYGVNIYWAYLEGEKKPSADQPVLFFMPGMTGNIEDPYVINIVMEGLKNGYNVCVYQFRLISPECTLPEGGVFSLHEDIDNALDLIRAKTSGKIYAIGGSYGANNLVYYLGQNNKINKKIEAAVSISNPYDMLICERMAEGTIFETLVTFLEKNNFKNIRKNVEKCKGIDINTEFIANCDIMKAYDEEFTRKVLGYKSADDYYRNISAYNKIGDVNIPILYISSRDDGMTSCCAIPFDDIRLNDKSLLLVTDRGAHMCFISNEKMTEIRQWVIKPVFEFLNANRDMKATI